MTIVTTECGRVECPGDGDTLNTMPSAPDVTVSCLTSTRKPALLTS